MLKRSCAKWHRCLLRSPRRVRQHGACSLGPDCTSFSFSPAEICTKHPVVEQRNQLKVNYVIMTFCGRHVGQSVHKTSSATDLKIDEQVEWKSAVYYLPHVDLDPSVLVVPYFTASVATIILVELLRCGSCPNLHKKSKQAYSGKACAPNGCKATVVRVVNSLHAPNRFGRFTPGLALHGSGCFLMIRLKMKISILF